MFTLFDFQSFSQVGGKSGRAHFLPPFFTKVPLNGLFALCLRQAQA
jgi:hypothetical protein